MKKQFVSAIVCLAAFAVTASAQIIITPNAVTYERTGAEVPDHKKKFSVRYPVVSGVSAVVKTQMDETLSFWKAFDTTLDENLADYYWLESFDYNVVYNKRNLLTIELTMEGSGAYPDGSVRTLVVNTKTGRKVEFGGAFRNIGKLLVLIDKAQKTEIKAAAAELNRESNDDGKTMLEEISSRRYETDKLAEFAVDDRGVTFLFDYGFPHALKPLEPEGRYFFTWTEMKPFVHRDGLLGSFIR